MVSLNIFLVSILAGTATAQWWPGRPGRTTTAAAAPPAATTSYVPPRGATQSLYGQCGGETYTGAIACPTGAYCKPSNQWYSQCIALEGANPQPGSPGEVRTLTTIFSVPGTVISTRITYLVPKPTTTSAQSVVTLTLVPDEPCDHPYYC